MTDKKFTDEEIIKAVECFALCKDMGEYSCLGCAFDKEPICDENASEGIAEAALDLINRQKAEIERIKSNYSKLCEYLEKMEFELSEINADISWFREAKISNLSSAVKEIKAEAYKEFAEKLKKSIEILQEERDYAQFPKYVKEAIKIAISAIEKQIPKSPLKTRSEIICQTCNTLVGSSPYCRYCGQAIDWSDTE